MELKERLVQQELRVRLVLLERTVPLDPWVHVVCLVREDVLELLELQVPEEMMACLALPVHLDQWVLLELLVFQDPQEQREKLVLLAAVALKDPRGHVERLVPQDRPDLLEHRVTLVLMVFPELKDLLVLLVLLVLLDSPAPVAHLDLREQQDL